MNDPFAQVAGLPGVGDAIASARESVDRLRGHRVLRRHGPEVSAESALRGARASAALEGASFPLADVRSGTARSPLVQGALRVSSELGSLAGPWRVAPGQALARLHALVAADAVAADAVAADAVVAGVEASEGVKASDGMEASALGRPRSSAVAEDPLGLGSPPSPDTVAVRLSALGELLTSPTSAPALVVAAIAHGELLALRAFGWGDGILARAAVRLTLIDRGVDPKSLAVPEVGHVELVSAYREAIHAYVAGTPEGVAQWVRHCAEAVALGAREALAICEAFTRRGA